MHETRKIRSGDSIGDISRFFFKFLMLRRGRRKIERLTGSNSIHLRFSNTQSSPHLCLSPYPLFHLTGRNSQRGRRVRTWLPSAPSLPAIEEKEDNTILPPQLHTNHYQTNSRAYSESNLPSHSIYLAKGTALHSALAVQRQESKSWRRGWCGRLLGRGRGRRPSCHA